MAAPTREEAWNLVCEWTESESLRKHMLGVEAAMRAYAREFGEDEELYGITGLLHDLDYERYPDLGTGHPREALKLFEEKGYPPELIEAVAGHATFLGVPRETRMAKTLYAVDELSGFISACAYVRPDGIHGMTPKSVKKKLKQPSFAAGVNRDDPSLRGRPVIVGGGVVLAASYEAKACGIESGMGGGRARRLCPDAVVVPCRFDAYVEASKAVFRIFDDTAPTVEALSIDEAFLDVRGMEHFAGTPAEIARRLRKRVREEVGLPVSVGVAPTKFLAKVASAVAKPDGLLEVPPGGELAFLHPLPVERLWGVGPVTAERLHDAGLRTVGQVAGVSKRSLSELLGPAAARHLHA